MTPEQGQLLSSIWEGIREIRGDQKAQAAQLSFLEGQRAKHEEAIENLKERQTGLHAKVTKLESVIRGPLMRPLHASPAENRDASWIWRLGMFVVENKATLAMVLFFGIGTFISIYNFFIVQLRKLPLISAQIAEMQQENK